MVCEGILNLCGTSSEEIINRTKKEQAEYYQPIIDELSDSNKELKVLIEKLNEKRVSEVNYLEGLLRQHNIPFHKDAGTVNEN